MPEFRSATDRSAEAGLIFRSELPVSSRLAMLPFFPAARTVRRSLDNAIEHGGGLLFYRLEADIRGKVFRVESAWIDQASFRTWVGSEPHRSVMAKLGPRVSGGTFDTEVRDPAAPEPPATGRR